MIIAIMNLARLQISESTNALMDLIKEENLIHYKVCTLLGLAICLNPSTPEMDPFGATVDVPAPIFLFFFLRGGGGSYIILMIFQKLNLTLQ